jgi:hypothetical protein
MIVVLHFFEKCMWLWDQNQLKDALLFKLLAQDVVLWWKNLFVMLISLDNGNEYAELLVHLERFSERAHNELKRKENKKGCVLVRHLTDVL